MNNLKLFSINNLILCPFVLMLLQTHNFIVLVVLILNAYSCHFKKLYYLNFLFVEIAITYIICYMFTDLSLNEYNDINNIKNTILKYIVLILSMLFINKKEISNNYKYGS